MLAESLKIQIKLNRAAKIIAMYISQCEKS